LLRDPCGPKKTTKTGIVRNDQRMRQPITFKAPVRIGHTFKAIVEITDLNPRRKGVTLRTGYLVKEDVVIDGEAVVMVPTRD
jgi:3-hydroxybutyryl-CoA dehydratase